ncbi:hypothetical protein HYALB_00006321 [Hymenoscyphus albidus]|uniref:Uncharacterized protein n=1 Tax=Hymenoscyphus albidus TaxID=595503 RepID=A0A9N9LLN8_9HELO|nr:hypothetical protein HYALB_00006321 [Hymenoscyphus albidus]
MVAGNDVSCPQQTKQVMDKAQVEKALRIDDQLCIARDGYEYQIIAFEDRHLNMAPNHRKIREYSTLKWEGLISLVVKAEVKDIELLVELHRNLAESFYLQEYRKEWDPDPNDSELQDRRRRLLRAYDLKWEIQRPTLLKHMQT